MGTKKFFFSVIASSILVAEALTFDATSAKVVQIAYSVNKDSFYGGDDYLGNKVYKHYYDNLVSNNMNIPIFNNMVPQGIALYNEYILTTSYDANKESNSCVYFLDKNGNLLNTCSLSNMAHVGGIAYDKINNLVWICGTNGCIDAYNPDDLLTNKVITPLYANFDVGDGLPNYKNPFLNSAAYLTIDGDNIYIGSFSLYTKGKVKKYKIILNHEERKLTLKYQGMFLVPSKVQGFTFYKKNDQKYIIFSRSYGKDYPSVIQIFKYDDKISSYDNNVFNIAYEAPAMLEQITCDQGLIYSIYESGAKRYSDSSDVITNIHVLDGESLVRKL